MNYTRSDIIFIIILFGFIRMCFNVSLEQSLVYVSIIALFGFYIYLNKKEEKKSVQELSDIYDRISEIQRDVNSLGFEKIK